VHEIKHDGYATRTMAVGFVYSPGVAIIRAGVIRRSRARPPYPATEVLVMAFHLATAAVARAHHSAVSPS
jgi:hypothetical protein